MSAAPLKPKPKGHWPKGKPRGFVVPPTRLRQVRTWFERHAAHVGPTPNERSVKGVARALNVSDRTVRRWLAGEDNPDKARWQAFIGYLHELGF